MDFESAFLSPQSIQVCHLRSKTPLTALTAYVDRHVDPTWTVYLQITPPKPSPPQFSPILSSPLLPHRRAAAAPLLGSLPAPWPWALLLPPRAGHGRAPPPSLLRPQLRAAAASPLLPRRAAPVLLLLPRHGGAPPPAGSARGAALPRPRQRGPSSGRLSGRRPWRVMARPWRRRPLLPPSPSLSLLPPSLSLPLELTGAEQSAVAALAPWRAGPGTRGGRASSLLTQSSEPPRPSPPRAGPRAGTGGAEEVRKTAVSRRRRRASLCSSPP